MLTVFLILFIIIEALVIAVLAIVVRYMYIAIHGESKEPESRLTRKERIRLKSIRRRRNGVMIVPMHKQKKK